MARPCHFRGVCRSQLLSRLLETLFKPRSTPASPEHIQPSLAFFDCITILRCDSRPVEMNSPSQPPPGGNQSQTKALMGMTIAMLSFSTIFVSLRFLVRIYVVKSVWWDDWTILFALVGSTPFLCFDAEFDSVRDCRGRRIGLRRIPLWLRSPSILHRWPSLWQIPILFVRRVDPDFCDLDVDEDIHLLLFEPYSSNKGLAKADVHCYYYSLYFQLDSHTFVDLTMYSRAGDLGFYSFGKMLHEEPAAGNNLSPRQ